ncbi:helix-turn-helix transcriptional regulator [Pseudoruegeria sp. HB172150]|uniref:ArsR/SmtB family transcription factor n=1 Tax=Pseudoruegeria sp. HB172150 TaxID=2721164 RepID=UPI0015545DF8|nr:metalloregulator ArsR/SmtB family transcription factor [Pseudoruegeria sp. HB172150]
MSKADPARVFSALGDQVRLDLLARLSEVDSLPLGRLVADCDMTRQGATKHLKVLEAAGLVEAETVGRERHLRLAPDGLLQAQSYLNGIARGWEDVLGRLKAHVERAQR